MSKIKLNNGQRKAIAAAKEREMDAIIKLAQEARSQTRSNLIKIAKEKYNIESMLNQIADARAKIDRIVERLKDLGYQQYDRSDSHIINGSQLDREIGIGLEALDAEIVALRQRKTEIVQKVWTAEHVSDLPEIPE